MAKLSSKIARCIFSWLEKGELAHLRGRMQVGKEVEMKKGLRVSHPQNITIGNHVSIGSDVMMQAHAPIRIGDYTLIAAGTKIVTANHNLEKREMAMRPTDLAPVVIGKSCWLGAGVVVLPGVTVGDGTVVGAGSVVSKDLPPETVCVGVPAKPIKPRPFL